MKISRKSILSNKHVKDFHFGFVFSLVATAVTIYK